MAHPSWLRRSAVTAAVLIVLIGSVGCAGGPRIDYWQAEPVLMDGARVPPPTNAGAAARVPPSRDVWDARSARLPFRDVTVSYMWDAAGLYGMVSGGRITRAIQVETRSTGRVDGDDGAPAVHVWLGWGDEIRTGGHDQMREVPRAEFAWDFAPLSAADAGIKEDRFFLPWATLGMSGPPAGPRAVHFVISDNGLLDSPRGGAWLRWTR